MPFLWNLKRLIPKLKALFISIKNNDFVRENWKNSRLLQMALTWEILSEGFDYSQKIIGWK